MGLQDFLSSYLQMGPSARFRGFTVRPQVRQDGTISLQIGYGPGFQVQARGSFSLVTGEWSAAVGGGLDPGQILPPGAPLTALEAPLGRGSVFIGFSAIGVGSTLDDSVDFQLTVGNSLRIPQFTAGGAINIRVPTGFTWSQLRARIGGLPAEAPGAIPAPADGGPVYDLSSPLEAAAYEAELYRRMDEAAAQGWTPNITLPSQCFVAGTPILMADGTERPIEQIRPGDLVMAFDSDTDHGRGALIPSRVTRTFENVAQTIVNLRGLRMTPGHVCLTDNGQFDTIAAILMRDASLVDRDGASIRARTGAPLGTIEDVVVRVAYTDPASGELYTLAVRAGIPCAHVHGPDGTFTRANLAEILMAKGIAIRPDGKFVLSGNILANICDWPDTVDPFATGDQQNWIVVGTDERRFIPEWIERLGRSAAAEALSANEPAWSMADIPHLRLGMIGNAVAALPRIGSALAAA